MSKRGMKAGAVKCYTLREIKAFEQEYFKTHSRKVEPPKAEAPRPIAKFKQRRGVDGRWHKKRVAR